MKKFTLTTKEIGRNGLHDLRDQTDWFVQENFELLYEGAIRLGLVESTGCHGPKKIRINHTRLHEGVGLEYACGHKYDTDAAPTKYQLSQTIKDIQSLIDAAAINVPAPFTLKIIKK